MTTLEGMVAIVTGASRGIGAAIVARLHADGAVVYGASRTGTLEGPGLARSVDVASSAAVDRLVDEVLAAHGHLDVFVNNAGVQLEKSAVDTSDAEFDAVVDVNVRGVFNGCRAAVRAMRGRGGVIVNIGSTAATHADHGMAVYNASKGAVHALTRSVAVDHGRDGVRCVAVAPGWVATGMAETAMAAVTDPDTAKGAVAARHPVGRIGRPDDVAGLVAWLVSADAGFANGSVFTLDGGATAQSPVTA